MSKKNKVLREKLRAYYRGPIKKPTLVANEEAMQIINKALTECIPLRSTSAFKCRFQNQDCSLKLVVGLSAGLRHLKRGRTRAIIFDTTASDHLANLLVEFAKKLTAPIIKASDLDRFAPLMKLKTLLMISLVDLKSDDTTIYKDSDPRPKPVTSTQDLQSFRDLVTLFEDSLTGDQLAKPESGKYSFKLPHVDQVKSTGKSKAKKEAKGKGKGKKLEESEKSAP